MLASYLLALREGMESALVLGIVLGALGKLGRKDLSKWVWAGTGAAILFSLIVAVILNLTGTELEGKGEVIFEGSAMIVAALLLTWMIFWMRTQAHHLQDNLTTGIRRAVAHEDHAAIFFLAALSVLRDGIELALFLLAVRLATNPMQTLVGALSGLASAVFLGIILFASTRRLNVGRLFQVTNVLLMLFAAGLVAHGVREFNEIGWIPAVISPLWNINPILPDGSILGQALSALLGYHGAPSLTEVLAYGLYFALLGIGLQFTRLAHASAPRETVGG